MPVYIDRDALVRDLIEKGFYPAIVKNAIETAKVADVAPARCGFWVRQDNTNALYECSKCHARDNGGHEKYCPNCGLRNV